MTGYNISTMKPKIALIIERADTSLGGAERSVFELAGAVSLLDYDVNILAAKGQTQTKNIHILCDNRPGKRTSLAAFARALKKHLYKNRYDIIHSTLPFDFADIYQPRGGTYPESIIRNAASYETKFLRCFKKITAFANLRRAALLRAERKIARSQAGPVIVAISDYVAQQFKSHYDADPQRITVIPNGIKIGAQIDVSQADNLRTQILAHFRLKEADNPVLFLFAANNFRLKGLSCLIKALQIATVKNKTSPAYLVVAGRGKSAPCIRLAKKLNIDNRIIFLGSIRHIQNVLAITNVAVLPTFYDPCSRFILEALAAQKPVITTRFNGAIDLFTDNRHGKVINDPRNIIALADAVNHFADPANIRTASDAIIEDNLITRISIARVAMQLKTIYDEIVEKRRRQS